jgi:alanyl-tRNA synthetase
MPVTERLYYHDSFLHRFEAEVVESLLHEGRHAVVLNRTAFYPTSGGQVHDTGMLSDSAGQSCPVTEVADEEDGRILHFVGAPLAVGTTVRGTVDAARRIDHMQQHSGQHVLSAAFIRLFDMPTVSFHMGVESCTIDIETNSITPEQVEAAEKLANEIITEDRPVTIRFVELEAARGLGLRKIPPKQTGELRLIDITDFDLTACGGTHVRSTGQIGAILLRKAEKVKQGVRVEFVCGGRAVATARKDYTVLSEAASAFSAHLYDVPKQIQKTLDDAKAAGKSRQKLLEELAELQAERLLHECRHSPCIVTAVFPERDAMFIKLLAQKLTASRPDVIALLASCLEQWTLVFAQSPGQKSNMGQLMKQVMSQLGGRGGGATELAQGGVPANTDRARIEALLRETASAFGSVS